MSTVRPKDLIAEIDLVYPPVLPGTGVIPLADETVDALQHILNLVDQIPRTLGPPQQADKDRLNRSTTLIREGMERARSRTADVRTPGFGFALQSIHEEGGAIRLRC